MCEHLCLCIYVAFLVPFFCLLFIFGCLSYSDLGVSVLSYFTFIPQMTDCFLRRDIKGVNSEGMGGEKELREIGGWKTITREYCMKKNYFKKKIKERWGSSDKRKQSWKKDKSHLEDSVADFFPESIQNLQSFMFLVRILQDLAPCLWVLTPLTEVGSL